MKLKIYSFFFSQNKLTLITNNVTHTATLLRTLNAFILSLPNKRGKENKQDKILEIKMTPTGPFKSHSPLNHPRHHMKDYASDINKQRSSCKQ